jgi:hypothetical protein
VREGNPIARCRKRSRSISTLGQPVKDLDFHGKELLDGDMVSCQAFGRFVR